MVVAPTRETFSRLFYSYRMSKNPRFLVENPILGMHITLWRKTKVIFWISALNYAEWCVAQHIFQKNNFSKKYGSGTPPAILVRKFFFEKTFCFLKDDSLSGIRLFLSKWKLFLSKKNRMSACLCESSPLCGGDWSKIGIFRFFDQSPPVLFSWRLVLRSSMIALASLIKIEFKRLEGLVRTGGFRYQKSFIFDIDFIALVHT